ncbi:serine/threonine-protein kinase NIM1-like [Limulus polyphemus]|uniref:Serine/threonine-protein kinase NIM1-like n=1 Tax=Limulus polyphemus TaxID=6850 RepID=A0ABM1C4Z4_LIMPO|nr:serine/threonine-protein kinase NIM1-like [Limulus polyphemus]
MPAASTESQEKLFHRTPSSPLLITVSNFEKVEVDHISRSNPEISQISASKYEAALQNLCSDDRWQKDIALGKRVGFYRIHGELGSGNFSKVKVASHCLTKQKVAAKIIDKSRLDIKTQRMLAREIKSMESLHHPHIIRLYEVIEALSKVYLIMEYASGGELFHCITSEGRLPEHKAKHLMAQVVSAVNHMHQNNIIHRDIKAENVFFAGPNVVKVGDFGFSTQVENVFNPLTTFCGSPPYAAPELFKDTSYIGPCVDIWALGVLLYFMVTASMPFQAQTVVFLKNLIIEGKFKIPSYVSKNCSVLIRGILQQNLKHRFNMKDIMLSEWLFNQNFPDELERYIMYPSFESSSRLTEEERETRHQLRNLGITDEMLQDCASRGPRSNITGTFRIVLYNLQTNPLEDTSNDSAPGTSLAERILDQEFNEKGTRKANEGAKPPNKISRMCILL